MDSVYSYSCTLRYWSLCLFSNVVQVFTLGDSKHHALQHRVPEVTPRRFYTLPDNSDISI